MTRSPAEARMPTPLWMFDELSLQMRGIAAQIDAMTDKVSIIAAELTKVKQARDDAWASLEMAARHNVST